MEQDWLDDLDRFTRDDPSGIFVTVNGRDSDEYTDFMLTREQAAAMFRAIAGA